MVDQVETEGLVIRQVDYGDFDRIVTLATRRLGVVPAFARGIRRPKSRLVASGFGVLLQLRLQPRRGEVWSLKEALVAEVFPRVLKDLSAMGIAGAWLEMVREGAGAMDPDPALFEELVQLMRYLAKSETAADRMLLWAGALRLLTPLGFAPELARCGGCQRVPEPNQSSLFDPSKGTLVCRGCGGGPLTLSGRTRMLMQHAASGEIKVNWPSASVEEASRALRALIEYRIERRLSGFRLFESLHAKS